MATSVSKIGDFAINVMVCSTTDIRRRDLALLAAVTLRKGSILNCLSTHNQNQTPKITGAIAASAMECSTQASRTIQGNVRQEAATLRLIKVTISSSITTRQQT